MTLVSLGLGLPPLLVVVVVTWRLLLARDAGPRPPLPGSPVESR